MVTSKLSQSQMIAGVGGVILVISQFLSWASGFGGSASAFDSFSIMDIIMLLIGLAAVAYAAAVGTGRASSVPSDAGLILSALGLIVVGWTLGWDLEFSYAGIGAWLGLLSGLAITYGGYTASRGSRVAVSG